MLKKLLFLFTSLSCSTDNAYFKKDINGKLQRVKAEIVKQQKAAVQG